MTLERSAIVCLLLVGWAAQDTWAQVEPPSTTTGAASAVDRLVGKADPLEDDWDTERLWVYSKKQLGGLFDLLRQPASGRPDYSKIVASEATCSLPSSKPKLHETLGFRVFQIPRAAGVAGSEETSAASKNQQVQVFDTWFEKIAPEFRGTRVEFKIVAVRPTSASSWATEVRVERFSSLEEGSLSEPILMDSLHRVETGGTRAYRDRLLEQTDYWNVHWKRGDDENHPLIVGLDVLSSEAVTCKAPLFRDATRAVIRDAWDEQLQFGGEIWYGRVDAVGEINFFGHNGIAIGDANGDGLEDLYVAMGTGIPNKLFLQNADGTVREVAEQAGVAWLDDTKGVIFADMDNDGDQDLLCAIGPTIVLCKNDGTGRFDRFVSMKAPTAASFYSLAVADYDLDGDLDIYGCRYVHLRYGISVPMPFHDAYNGPPNHLMRNDGNDRYTDVTEEVGLNVRNTRFSLVAAWTDYDNDGDPDLCVANDFGRKNLYRNDEGKFKDVAEEAGAEDQGAGMGASWSDFDLDGDLDVYFSNMFSSAGNRIAYQARFKEGLPANIRGEIQRHSWGNTLLENLGGGKFQDISETAGVRMGRWAWGAKFVDINNDGYDDLFVPNGFLTNDRKDDL